MISLQYELTTYKKFLEDLGLRSLTELPPLTEIERIMDLVGIPGLVSENKE